MGVFPYHRKQVSRMAKRELPTLILMVSSLDDLDSWFKGMKRDKSWRTETNIAKPWEGALLAGYGPKDTGDLYVFVGRLIEPAKERVGDRLYFEDVERFWHPVVAVFGKHGIHREDLIGDIQGWGPSDHFYGQPGIVDLVTEEAQKSLARAPQ
jgi:hypothetical protein